MQTVRESFQRAKRTKGQEILQCRMPQEEQAKTGDKMRVLRETVQTEIQGPEMLFTPMCGGFAGVAMQGETETSKTTGMFAMRKTVCTASGDKSKLLQQALQNHTSSKLRDENTGVEERTNLYPMRKDLHSTAERTEILHKGVSA